MVLTGRYYFLGQRPATGDIRNPHMTGHTDRYTTHVQCIRQTVVKQS